MATYTGTSLIGLQFIGATGDGENLVVVYDTRELSVQGYRKKGVVLAYQRPTYVPAGLSSIHVGHTSLYYGGTSLIIPRLQASLPTFILINWAVSGVPYRIDTGFTA